MRNWSPDRSHLCQADSRCPELERGRSEASVADGGPPAWRTCSLPPVCPASGRRGAAETRGPAARVRPAAGAGWHSFKASPGFLAQPPRAAGLPPSLPPPEEGSLLSGLISCQSSVFFLFLLQPRANRWGGEAAETGLAEWGLAQGLASGRQSVSFPQICPPQCVSGPRGCPLPPSFLACLLFQKHYTRQAPPVPRPPRRGYTPNSWV